MIAVIICMTFATLTCSLFFLPYVFINNNLTFQKVPDTDYNW